MESGRFVRSQCENQTRKKRPTRQRWIDRVREDLKLLRIRDSEGRSKCGDGPTRSGMSQKIFIKKCAKHISRIL